MNLPLSAPQPGRGVVAMLGVLAFAAIVSSGCDNGPEAAATITLDIPTTNLLVGQTVQITPTVKDAKGKILLDRTVVYQSSVPSAAGVTSTGTVVALNPGSTSIIATVEGVTAQVGIVVSPIPVRSVTVTPDSLVLDATMVGQLTATALDSAGHVLSDRPVTWSSSNDAIARVSSSGVVTGVAAGSATITANIEGKSGSMRVRVPPPPVASITVTPSFTNVAVGTSTRFVATVRDLTGAIVTGRTITWSSTDPNAASVDSTGLVRGLASGSATIYARTAGVFGAAAVIVVFVPVASVAVKPDTLTLFIGDIAQAFATPKDANGATLGYKPVTWESADTTIATVSSTGAISAIDQGTVHILAHSESATGVLSLTVLQRETSSSSTATRRNSTPRRTSVAPAPSSATEARKRK